MVVGSVLLTLPNLLVIFASASICAGLIPVALPISVLAESAPPDKDLGAVGAPPVPVAAASSGFFAVIT